MIPGGYILQPRCFDKSNAAHFSPVTRELWFYLLRKVNHTDKGNLKRGQGFFNISDIQKDLSWMVGYRTEMYSKPQFTKALRRLREELMIVTTKTTRGVIISVCNYDEYQTPESYEGSNEGCAKETRGSFGGRTINKNERRKEGKKTTTTSKNGNTCPHQKIIAEYNSALSGVLPKVKPNMWGGERSKRLAARWNENEERQNLEWWRSYFSSVKKNTFLLGENERGWRADIHWLLNLDNMAKVMEGKYEQKQKEADEWI